MEDGTRKLLKRFMLLLLYALVSAILVAVVWNVSYDRYGIGGGATAASLNILGSWALVIFHESPFWLYFGFFLYLAFLFVLNTILARLMRTDLPVVPYVVHAIGIVAAWIITAGHVLPDLSVHPLFILICAVPSAAAAALYLTLDWWLAKGLSVRGKARHILQKIKSKWFIAAALCCLSLIAAGELVRVHQMKIRMSEIMVGMTRSDVLHKLGRPQWQLPGTGEMIPESREDRHPTITRFIYQLSLFDRSGIVIFIDNESDKVIRTINKFAVITSGRGLGTP